MGRVECPLFDVACPALPRHPTALPNLQGALLKDGEADVTCGMPAPCEFPSLLATVETWKHRLGVLFN